MTEQTFDVVALGELLIDFTMNGTSEQGNPLFEANPGGAPCNVLAMLKKLGRSCAFVGKVGDDLFGRQLRQVAEEAGICMDALAVDPQVRTTLAFVKTFANGDRDFSFYRNPGADMALTADELPEQMLSRAKIFHFGTLSLTHQPVRSATQKAVELARAGGAVISFDPNLRPPLWSSLEEARQQIAWGLARCDVLKNRRQRIGIHDRRDGFCPRRCPAAAPVPQHPAAGCDRRRPGQLCLLRGRSRCSSLPAPGGGVIETTGAGDTFCACVLDYVLSPRAGGPDR